MDTDFGPPFDAPTWFDVQESCEQFMTLHRAVNIADLQLDADLARHLRASRLRVAERLRLMIDRLV